MTHQHTKVLPNALSPVSENRCIPAKITSKISCKCILIFKEKVIFPGLKFQEVDVARKSNLCLIRLYVLYSISIKK